ncbi:hypothetical protein OF83DRAFT_259611 [Amylostereum chailletii]|nr:hypothetical protein OF83DRAFT_259611 [Amylostereum chailletii]
MDVDGAGDMPGLESDTDEEDEEDDRDENDEEDALALEELNAAAYWEAREASPSNTTSPPMSPLSATITGQHSNPDAANANSLPAPSPAIGPQASRRCPAPHSQGSPLAHVNHFPGQAGEAIGASQSPYADMRNKMDSNHRNNIWAPFRSKLDWSMAYWAKSRGATSSAVTDLLQIDDLYSFPNTSGCRTRTSTS